MRVKGETSFLIITSEKRDVLMLLLLSLRQQKRSINHQASTLEDGLEMLPLPDAKTGEEVTVPVTGQDIRDLDGKLSLLFSSRA